MSRRISQSIAPTADDVAKLRGPFIAKGANDPVIAELRDYFKAAVPTWLARLDEKQELTRERLAQIREAADKRRVVIDALPEGKARQKALDDLDATVKVIDEMDSDLAGVSAFSGIN